MSCRPHGRPSNTPTSPEGGTVAVIGLGPIGDMSARIAQHRGARVIGVDLVPERLARAEARGIETIDLSATDGPLGDRIRDLTDGRGTDSVIDAVGMEAHGSPPVAKFAQTAAGLLPSAVAEPLMQKAGVDRLAALYSAIDVVRRGGTVSLSGVYGGAADPHADADHVRQADHTAHGGRRTSIAGCRRSSRCSPTTIRSASTPSPRIGSRCRRLPHAYDIFQRKADGAVKILLEP